MRVLHVSGSCPPMRCGVGDYTARLASAMSARRDLQVAVLTSTAVARTEAGPTVLPLLRAWGIRDLEHAVAAMRRWAPDIVHIQHPTLGYEGGMLPTLLAVASRAIGARLVRTWHEPRGRHELPRLLIEAAVPGPIVMVRPDLQQRLHPWVRRLLGGHDFHFIRNGASIPRSRLDAQGLDAFRVTYIGEAKRLIVFFGFPYEAKGVADVFEIADPATDHIVFAGAVDPNDNFIETLHARAASPPWAGKVSFSGFLSDTVAADLLAAADAVVLPFRDGGGVWNSSIHAAVRQRSLVITTSRDATGYDAKRHLFAAAPGDIAAMRQALAQLTSTGRPTNPVADDDDDDWPAIAARHVDLYTSLLPRQHSARARSHVPA